MTSTVSSTDFQAGSRRLGAGRPSASRPLQAAQRQWLLRLLFLLALIAQASLPAWADHGSLGGAETAESAFQLCAKDGLQSQDPRGSHPENSGHGHYVCVLCCLSYGGAALVAVQDDGVGVAFPPVVSRLTFASDSFSSPLRRGAANRCRAPPLFL
ncbi:DUF2946 family protein [Methylocystis heyeri]|uniref:DUF2946 domain-containing protein n=1 Tax=Methylocystis heyeri TaxID=391905 RepID=A0A6B8K949_9HYPH|nr:DUF2946 family protein [Methylocystis heyeri]QGM44227.1 hypothetical protein H2LOC_000075 [Methylocystis heyeri]